MKCPYNCFEMYLHCARLNRNRIKCWRCPECGVVVLTV